jgi:hyaluronoglucosaminidase
MVFGGAESPAGFGTVPRVSRFVLGTFLAAAALCVSGSVRATPVAVAPPLYPVPQSVVPAGTPVAVPAVVRIITTPASDPSAVAAVRSALAGAGIATTTATSAALWIYIGRNLHAERELGVQTAAGLPAEGYVLAVGRGHDGTARVVLDGATRTGQFYAAQTFRQLLGRRSTMPALVIRDWPSFRRRGVVEGFYGKPWSLAQTLSMLDFMGAHKLDFFMYGPKSDGYLRENWRAPFPASYRSMLRSLVGRAATNHVTFDLVLSPGLSVCYTSPADRALMLAKLSSAYALGVRSFTLAFDDIPRDRPLCPMDASLGQGDTGLALAQAQLANDLEDALRAAHPGLAPLIVVPTDYSGVDPTAYTDALAGTLDPALSVEWTGRYGTSVVISHDDAAAAVAMYRHPVIIWDNYWVTDYAPGYLALGALDRHDPTLPSLTSGIVADPMTQPQASRIGLFTLADYAWNAPAYDLTASWNASLKEFAGGGQAATSALRVFADFNWGSGLNELQAPGLAAAIDRFWTQWTTGDASAAKVLDTQFATLAGAPAVLTAKLGNPEFLAEAAPWLNATQAWARAARAAVALLVDTSAGNSARAAADRTRLAAAVATAQRFALLTPPISAGGSVVTTFIQSVETQAGG